MMWTTIEKIMAFAGLFLLVETSIASGQIFQWTDVKGVIHFTDNSDSIPESIRNSSTLIVRKDMDTKKHSSVTILTLSQHRRSRARPARSMPTQSQSQPPW